MRRVFLGIGLVALVLNASGLASPQTLAAFLGQRGEGMEIYYPGYRAVRLGMTPNEVKEYVDAGELKLGPEESYSTKRINDDFFTSVKFVYDKSLRLTQVEFRGFRNVDKKLDSFLRDKYPSMFNDDNVSERDENLKTTRYKGPSRGIYINVSDRDKGWKSLRFEKEF